MLKLVSGTVREQNLRFVHVGRTDGPFAVPDTFFYSDSYVGDMQGVDMA
jgi:hypothetical protein